MLGNSLPSRVKYGTLSFHLMVHSGFSHAYVVALHTLPSQLLVGRCQQLLNGRGFTPGYVNQLTYAPQLNVLKRIK